MLYCPNYTCQTPNLESYQFCQKCRTLLPHHYLWAVGESASRCLPGEILVDRYVCKSSRIFLDTKPGLYSVTPTDLPPDSVSYLRLSPYQIHIPQVYDVVSLTPDSHLVLLDQAALDTTGLVFEGGVNAASAPIHLQLLPSLTDGWESATAVRQLNWLWQMAYLWQPLASQQVVSSVLAPELIRVEGGLLRLLELRADGAETLTLAQLGQLWSTWVESAHPTIAKGLTQICQQLIQGQIRNAEQLIGQIDSLIAQVGRSLSYQIQIATRTDQGPSRQRNEDACYPPSGTVETLTSNVALVIVCDGIGGHQGGDVASNLAIEAIRQQVQSLDLESLDVPSLTLALEKAACVANDLISQRNDSEQRFDRQRMGTTLVMGLVRAPELYLTHVGDSRAYWISPLGCHQVTQDDDVASREVRLGYSFYREALQQPSAGSLVQALGMGSSSILHPTVQRFLLDEDSVFLLCSDGLSDNDRVEESWRTTILPLLAGRGDVGGVSQQLIELANSLNGHDNVTVGLIHVRVTANASAKSLPPATVKAIAPATGAATLIQAPSSSVTPAAIASPLEADSAIAKTKVLPTRPVKPFNALPLLLGILILVGGGGLLAYSLSFSFRGWIDTLLGLNPVPSPTPSLSTGASPISPTPVAPSAPLPINAVLQVNPSSAALPAASQNTIVVFSRPGGLQPPIVDASLVPPGSIVQVIGRQATTQQDPWVQLRVCSIAETAQPPQSSTSSAKPVSFPTSPTPADLTSGSRPPRSSSELELSPTINSPTINPSAVPPPQFLPPGGTGWIEESEILGWVSLKSTVTPQELGACTISPAPGSAEPAISKSRSLSAEGARAS